MKPEKRKKEEFPEFSNEEPIKLVVLANKQELNQIDKLTKYLYNIGAIEEEKRSITIKYTIQHFLAVASRQSIKKILNYPLDLSV